MSEGYPFPLPRLTEDYTKEEILEFLKEYGEAVPALSLISSRQRKALLIDQANAAIDAHNAAVAVEDQEEETTDMLTGKIFLGMAAVFFLIVVILFSMYVW